MALEALIVQQRCTSAYSQRNMGADELLFGSTCSRQFYLIAAKRQSRWQRWLAAAARTYSQMQRHAKTLHQKFDSIDSQFINKSKFASFFICEYAISFDSIVQHKMFVFVADVRIVFVSKTHIQPSRGRQFVVPILIKYALPTLLVSLWCHWRVK